MLSALLYFFRDEVRPGPASSEVSMPREEIDLHVQVPHLPILDEDGGLDDELAVLAAAREAAARARDGECP
jgi:hypothetical protein